ncbi:hypothetical protein GQ55_2G321600 [Panicum hallii var. hallii]|uniref:Uncharacterized protein n=1 Tax=Panicum hallii var. hallii TaxID=1504633 RepID=A0A2T7EUQ6_9POAL|nr:hypothetical protein GQ55_2G321600 [Panicum hallii var. hallii]
MSLPLPSTSPPAPPPGNIPRCRRPFTSDLPSCASHHRPPCEPPLVPMALVGGRKARGFLGKWKSKKARRTRNNGSKKRPAAKEVVWKGMSRFSIMACPKSPETSSGDTSVTPAEENALLQSTGLPPGTLASSCGVSYA